MNLYIAPNLWGTPSDGGVFNPSVFQGMENSCAIHAQYHILRDFGYEGSVDDLRQEAIDNGWYNDDVGTNLCDVGKLLEKHGVACDMYADSNAFNLANQLAQGKRVIVSVDSGELWAGSSIESLFEATEDAFGIEGADHAVVVSGLDMSDPDNPMVTLTDSGSGHAAISYPLDQFTDAWRDGHCTMWVTRDVPPSASCPEMANFNYDLGHVESIGEIPYEAWAKELMDMVADAIEIAIPVVVGGVALLDVIEGDPTAGPVVVDAGRALLDKLSDLSAEGLTLGGALGGEANGDSVLPNQDGMVDDSPIGETEA